MTPGGPTRRPSVPVPPVISSGAVLGFTVAHGKLVAIDALYEPERLARIDLAPCRTRHSRARAGYPSPAVGSLCILIRSGTA